MKRIIALLLAVVMVAAMFAGCQNSDANTTTPSTDESAAPSETDWGSPRLPTKPPAAPTANILRWFGI